MGVILLFKDDQILDSIIVLCDTPDAKVLSVNYEPAELLTESSDTTLTQAQYILIDALMQIHQNNINIESKGILVLNPDQPVSDWKYDHDPDGTPNATMFTLSWYEKKVVVYNPSEEE